MKSLLDQYELNSALRFLFVFTLFFANSPWIHYFLWNRFEFTILITLSLWLHNLSRDFSMNSLSVTLNPLSISRFDYGSTIYFGNLLWIHYLFRAFPMNSQSSLQFYYEFTIFFAKSLWIHYQFLKSTFNTLSISRYLS